MHRLNALLWTMTIASGLPGVADPCTAAEKSDTEAEVLMRQAHVARSGWDASFPGFKADLRVAIDGQVVEGKVTIAGGDVKLDLPEGPAAAWAAEQLESITMHRTASVRDRYDVSFADAEQHHPLGRLIKFHGGTTHSLYRIKDDVITEVHRTMEKTKFTISVTDVTRNAEGQTLPRHFNVSYWDAGSGQLQSNHDFTDDWLRLGKFDLPKSRLLVRTAQSTRRVYQMLLTNHELLKEATLQR
jgi:hypothetical protein